MQENTTRGRKVENGEYQAREKGPGRSRSKFLSLAVRTLMINGKRMTPAFYKQISEADLIDEHTAELRGVPLGYFHLHTKECPQLPHKHVLWAVETKLHLATIVARKDQSPLSEAGR